VEVIEVEAAIYGANNRMAPLEP